MLEREKLDAVPYIRGALLRRLVTHELNSNHQAQPAHITNNRKAVRPFANPIHDVPADSCRVVNEFLLE